MPGQVVAGLASSRCALESSGAHRTNAEIGSRALCDIVCSGMNLLKAHPVLWAQCTS
jgi:hypothetical protein